MMKVKMAFCFIALLISFAAFPQQKPRLHSINMGGITSGKSGGYAILQTVNGLKYKKFFAGIGVGIDYYKNKTIPLFLDGRAFIMKTNFFVFGDLGYNFPSHDTPGKEIYHYDTYNFFGGSYSELGIGYQLRLGGQHLLFTSGYSYKKLNNKIGIVSPCLVAPCPLEYSTYEYGYGRINFKAGVSF